jgi:hypothetical protein
MPHPHRNRLHSIMMNRLVSSRVTKGSTSSCSSYHRSYSSSVACARRQNTNTPAANHLRQSRPEERGGITGCVQACMRATPLERVAKLPVSETERPPSVGDIKMPQAPPELHSHCVVDRAFLCETRSSARTVTALSPHCHCLFAWTYRGTGLGHKEEKHDRDGQQDPLNHKERVHMAVAPIPARQQHTRKVAHEEPDSVPVTSQTSQQRRVCLRAEQGGKGREQPLGRVQVLTTVPSCCRWC